MRQLSKLREKKSNHDALQALGPYSKARGHDRANVTNHFQWEDFRPVYATGEMSLRMNKSDRIFLWLCRLELRQVDVLRLNLTT